MTKTSALEESIYNLIPHETAEESKGKRYKSKFRENVKTETVQNKSGTHKTFGLSHYDVTTNDYLKKHTNRHEHPEFKAIPPGGTADNHCGTDGETGRFKFECRTKPPIPTKEDRPVQGLRTTKNFVHVNAVENILSVPRKAQKKYADTRIGDTHMLEPSGLEPVYLKKQEFGKVPEYLIKRNAETKKAQEEYNKFVKEYLKKGEMTQLSEMERDEIINGLKSNWERIHHMYQGLSVTVDTIPKKMRKERLEAEMKELEKDIDLLERHKLIYIA